MEVVNALGRRKSAIARIFVTEGTGNACNCTFTSA